MFQNVVTLVIVRCRSTQMNFVVSGVHMSETTSVEKARLRREKILAQGQARLSKITKTQNANFREDEAPVTTANSTNRLIPNNDDPEEVDISQGGTLIDEISGERFKKSSPLELPDNFGAVGVGGGSSPFHFMRNLDGTAGMPELIRPFTMQNDVASGDMQGNPFAILERLMSAGGMGEVFGSTGQPDSGRSQTQNNPYQKYWKWIHVLMMTLLISLTNSFSLPSIGGVKGVIRENGMPIFWYFTTIEIVLQSTRMLFEKVVCARDKHVLLRSLGVTIATLSACYSRIHAACAIWPVAADCCSIFNDIYYIDG